MKRRSFTATGIAAGLVALLLTGCSGAAPSASSLQPTGTVELTMWARSVTAVQSQGLVDAFNASQEGKIHVTLTVVPFAQYPEKVGAAASTHKLPDLLGANVIDGPKYAQSGLWADITSRVDSLSFASTLAPALVEAATVDKKIYAVPHVSDVSSLYYNKVLFKAAGLDPEKPPTTLSEMAADAKKISALGNGIGGLYLPGNCGGCLAFTLFPSIWAAGGEAMNSAGTEADLASKPSEDVFSIYHDMWTSGSILPESRNETGATQNAAFEAGTAGFALLGSKALGTLKLSDKLDIGIAPISGPDGGTSTFVGGDVLGISSSSTKADAAWTFLDWTLQKEQQLSIFAANKFLTVRTDLADNTYAESDPRLVLLNSLVAKGKSPYSARFFSAFNDPTAPFLSLAREAIFGSGPSSLTESNAKVTDELKAQ